MVIGSLGNCVGPGRGSVGVPDVVVGVVPAGVVPVGVVVTGVGVPARAVVPEGAFGEENVSWPTRAQLSRSEDSLTFLVASAHASTG